CSLESTPPIPTICKKATTSNAPTPRPAAMRSPTVCPRSARTRGAGTRRTSSIRVRGLMTAGAQRDDVLHPVGGKQSWLTPHVRRDGPPRNATGLTREVIAAHGRRAHVPKPPFVLHVERDMERHAQCHGQTRPGRQRGSPGGGESDVISDPHRCSYDTLMPRTVREGSHGRDTTPLCGPSPSRDRSPE